MYDISIILYIKTKKICGPVTKGNIVKDLPYKIIGLHTWTTKIPIFNERTLILVIVRNNNYRVC